uniref:Putative secreted protein n=1 Tax=Ixodes ricinus TaxID=34613 RepID=A0A6B0TZ46_IXORI
MSASLAFAIFAPAIGTLHRAGPPVEPRGHGVGNTLVPRKNDGPNKAHVRVCGPVPHHILHVPFIFHGPSEMHWAQRRSVPP